MSAGDRLRALQDADSHVAAMRAARDAAREEVRRDRAVERAREASDAAARDATAATDEAARAEQEHRALDSRVRTLDRRLYGGSVHNPHELMEMQRELEVLREQLRDAETATLERLERADLARAASAAAQDDLRVEEARREASLPDLRARAASLEEELTAAIAERDRAAAQVGERDMALYQRVAARHQPAVAHLAGDACGGCHLPLSIEERRAVRTGTSLVQCSGCDRILVP